MEYEKQDDNVLFFPTDNVVVWTYKARALSFKDNSPHNSQEWKNMFWPIYNLLNIFESVEDKKRKLSDWNREYKNYTRFWEEKYDSEIRLSIEKRLTQIKEEKWGVGVPSKFFSEIKILKCREDKYRHVTIDYQFEPRSIYDICISHIEPIDSKVTLLIKDVITDSVISQAEISSPMQMFEIITGSDVDGIEFRIYPGKVGEVALVDEIILQGVCIWKK